MKKLIGLRKPGTRLFSKPWRDLKILGIEAWWKHSVEKKVLARLEPTGLIPETPPNIVNKLNIFMVNVLRFQGGGDMSALVDGVDSAPDFADFAAEDAVDTGA